METAAESKKEDLAEALLRFFVDQGQRECYSACLYICYDLIRPDVVLELSWRCNLMNFAMPFMVQSIRDIGDKLNAVSHKLDETLKKQAEEEEKKKKHLDEAHTHEPLVMGPGGLYNPMGGPQLLMPPPGMYPTPGAPAYPHPGFGPAPGFF